jgi:hypothetical protein
MIPRNPGRTRGACVTLPRAYRIVVEWRDGRRTIEATSDDPTALKGAPTIARNPRSINRIELHDTTGCLETIWASHWVGYQRADNPPPLSFSLRS